jgi:hypothetical protein
VAVQEGKRDWDGTELIGDYTFFSVGTGMTVMK